MESADQEPILFSGRTPGTIVEMSGDTSFGWDPNFKPDGHDQTYAEMEKTLKNSISHRGRASVKMIEYFKAKQAGNATE